MLSRWYNVVLWDKACFLDDIRHAFSMMQRMLSGCYIDAFSMIQRMLSGCYNWCFLDDKENFYRRCKECSLMLKRNGDEFIKSVFQYDRKNATSKRKGLKINVIQPSNNFTVMHEH